MITIVRVDHRLLHGQVIYSWLKSIDCNAILITNDAVANDEVRQQLLSLSAPGDKKLLIRGITQSIAILNNPKNQPVKFFVIVENILDAWRLSKDVTEIKSVNIGSIKAKERSEKINNAVFLDEHDKTILRQFQQKNIALDVRQVAGDTAITIDHLL